MRLMTHYLIGLVFGIGISVSGMANPAKVLNFFDIAGTWDPSLIFVMGGALVTAAVGYRVVLRRSAPLFDTMFHLPTRRDLDASLLGGAALFGVGWGVTGFCPGGALPALGTGRAEVAIFVASMAAGIVVTRLLRERRSAAGQTG